VALLGVGFRLDAPFAALICLASIFLSLPTTIWRFFNPYFRLMHVALLKLLAADYWPITEAGGGFRPDASIAAPICFAVFSTFLSLPATVWSLFSPYSKPMHVALLGVGFRLDAPFAALICLASTFLSLPTTIWRFFNPYFKLMHVALLKLLAADYWPITEAGVGFRLDASFAALICFAVFSTFLSLPATVWSLFSPYSKLMHVALLGVGFRLDAPFAALICLASIFLSLPTTIWRFFNPYFKLMHVALLKLLAADYWPITEAGVGFRLDAPFAALICFAVFSTFLSLPNTGGYCLGQL